MTLPIEPPQKWGIIASEGLAAFYRLRYEEGQDQVYQAADNAVRSIATTEAVPVNTVLPSVTPATGVIVGTALSCTTGSWSGNPSAYAYQWKSNAANVGTNSPNYTVVAGDSTHSVTCVVTASNTKGSTPATSNAVAVP